MANELPMARVQTVLTLFQQGWSRRRIARELGLDRGAVARHIRLSCAADPPAKPAISTTGISEPTTSKPAISTAGTESGRRSLCDPFRDTIIAKMEAGLSAQRIFQDLLTEHGFAGGYESVKRMVRRLNAAQPLPFRRMECAAGAEAQIDFGTGAPLLSADGKRRKTHVLRIVLSHSRKGYSEVVSRQTTENLIAVLENAFWLWGGVPTTLVIDNTRAAVQQADWYDPELNPKLQAFCKHYGTVVLPTKPYMPRHKGKIENGIGYVKNNALKGRSFETLNAQNEHLSRWEERVADSRIHGTTKKQVRQLFQAERPALLPLPAERFPFFHEGQRIVHRDGHVEVERSYYSVPPEYLGRTVWVRWDSRLVRIFNAQFVEIALHAKHEPGRFSTDGKHLAAAKISSVERGATELLRRARLVGPQTARWAEAVLKARSIEGVRVLVGLLALVRQHSASIVEQACGVAAHAGLFRLRELRACIKEPVVHSELEFMAQHPVIRSLHDYGTLVNVHFENAWQEPAVQPPTEENGGPVEDRIRNGSDPALN